MVKIAVFMLLALTSKCIGDPSWGNHLLNDVRDMEECIRDCPKTSEYNPICGSNLVKYWNPGHLGCAQTCGEDVNPTHPPPCTPNGSITENDNNSDIDQCIWECPKTSEYNPVCGSDGKHYNNESTLKCAQQCGVDVKLTHPAPCRLVVAKKKT